MSIGRCCLGIALMGGLGCATRKPIFLTYRLVNENNSQILVPPGISTASVAKRTFTSAVVKGDVRCPPSTEPVRIRVRKKRARVSVDGNALLQQRPGWLGDWAMELEQHGCLAPHEGWRLAQGVIESLPLPLNTPFRLLYPSQMDVAPPLRLQVVSPIQGEGTQPIAPMEGAVQATEGGAALTVQSAANLIGYENAWYAVQPKSGGIGFTIAPLYAERHIDGQSQLGPRPSIDYLQFPPEASFYRLYHKAGDTEFAQLILAARTRAELRERLAAFETGTASCQKLNGDLCIAIPKAVAVNLCLPVTVNRAEIVVRWGATLGEAIRQAGERQPQAILPQLKVYKPHGGRPAPVEFDRASVGIFHLILTGGEMISWK